MHVYIYIYIYIYIYVYVSNTLYCTPYIRFGEWRSVLNNKNSIQQNHGSLSSHLQTQRFLKKGDIKHFKNKNSVISPQIGAVDLQPNFFSVGLRLFTS